MISWAVRRPAVVWAAAAAILLAGVVSFTRLALATRTSVELPELSVSAQWQGASAEVVEMYLTSPIEAAIQSVRGVKRTTSESRDGSSALRVLLEPSANVQLTRLAILERLEVLRGEFPPGVSPPRVSNYVPEALDEAPLMMFTINGPYTPGALQKMANEQIAPRIAAVEGVGGVEVPSRVQLGVAISYDPTMLRQVGVSPQLLADALAASRLVQSVGEERFGSTQREIVLRDQPAAIEELGNLPMRAPSGRLFRLSELATIRPDEDARGSFMRIDGQPAIAMTVSRLPGADAIRTAAGLRRTIEELGGALPDGIRLRIVADESEYLKTQLRDLVIRGSLAFLAVIVVLGLTLRSLRAIALVMGSAAIAIAGTALGLYVFRIPANLLTLAGLGMGIGVLVQNGIVVVERLSGTSADPESRAGAAKRILPAVLGATLTTAVVLFPFLYLQGDARAAFFPFAAAFGLGLAWSIVSAVVMIPAISGDIAAGGLARSWPRSQRFYTRLVLRLVRWKWATIAMAMALLGLTTWGFVARVPRWSFGSQAQQRTQLQVGMTFPRGSDYTSLDAAMREFESLVLGNPGVEQVLVQGQGSSARMRVLFSRDAEFGPLPEALQDELTQRAVLVGGASVSVQGQGPGYFNAASASTISSNRIRVLGYSYAGVAQIADDIAERLGQIARVRDVRVGSGSMWGGEKAFQITLEPDRAKLARFGLTSQQFAAAVAREVNGPVGQQRIEVAGEEVPVTIKTEGARERSLEELKESLIPTLHGTPVRLADVSTVSEREVLGTVRREDQQYIREVSYDFRGPAKLAQRTHESFMKSIAVPAGYRVGDQNTVWYAEDDSDKGLWLVFAVGVVLVVLAVAMVFDSAWAAWMIFLSLPLALGGVTAAFWAFEAPFSREAAVGVILVVGLAVNQAILLVDAALERRRARLAGGTGRLTPADVVHAARDRAGMIVLVTLSTLASLLPLAVGTSLTDQFGAIALGTAGGTVAGTLGAMLVLPAVLLVRGRGEARGISEHRD